MNGPHKRQFETHTQNSKLQANLDLRVFLLSPEEVFQLHPKIRWAAFASDDGKVHFVAGENKWITIIQNARAGKAVPDKK